MHFKEAALLVLALNICLGAQAQQNCHYTFSGTIVDQHNDPLIGAGIQIMNHHGLATDGQGRFRFTDLCEGDYMVKVQHLGYQEVEFILSVTTDVVRTITLDEVATQLSEVVIHHDAFHTEHVNNYVQLEGEQLAERAGRSLGATLKGIPGINAIQSGPGIFKPVIHGLHSQRVLILNHGLKQESQQWGAEHAPEIDPQLASNIIVIKDASAIKYGTGALGGVIVVNPKPLPEKEEAAGIINTVLQSNGRSGTISGMLEGGIPQHRGWGWRLQGTVKQGGDYNAPAYVLSNTGIRELNVSVATGYHRERAGIDIFFSRFETELGILRGTSIGSLEDLLAAMNRNVPAYTADFTYEIGDPRQAVDHNLLKVSGHAETKAGEWRWQYGFQNNNRKEYDMRRSAFTDVPTMDLRLNTHSADIGWETHHSEKRTVSVGMNGSYQSNTNIPGTQRIPFIPNYRNLSAGIYGVTKFYLERNVIDAGLRFDYAHYDVKGFDVTNTYYERNFAFQSASGTLGLTKQLNANQTLQLNLSTTWRPPHVSELLSSGKHQSAASVEHGLMLDEPGKVKPAMDIKSEQAFKFVSTWQLRQERFVLEVSPYANYILNYIYLRPEGISQSFTGPLPFLRYRQTDAMFLGADFTCTWNLSSHIKAIPQVSLLRTSDVRHHDVLISTPANWYEVTLRYEKPKVGSLGNFYIESETRYVAKQTRQPRVVTVEQIIEAQRNSEDPFQNDPSAFDFLPAPEGYFIWNLSAGVTLKKTKVSYDFRLACENTLNQEYREYTNRFRYFSDEIGRNIILTFKCSF